MLKPKSSLKEKLEEFFWTPSELIKNWIWPGYYLRNCLFHRYDLIKIPNIKPWEFIEADYQIYYGVMEPLRKFVDANPEEHVCWYKDENGKDLGHKYGENPDRVIMFPELKGKYIMDLIKEIYNFYTKEEKSLTNDMKWLLKIWSTYIINFEFVSDSENPEFVRLEKTKTEYTLNDGVIQALDWKRLKKYNIDQNNFFTEDHFYKQYKNLELEICKKRKYYLHLAIEIRDYLWT